MYTFNNGEQYCFPFVLFIAEMLTHLKIIELHLILLDICYYLARNLEQLLPIIQRKPEKKSKLI